MYSRGSVVGKASTIDPEISPTAPLIFGDFKLGMASYLKWERTGVARVVSSCNAFAIVTFSSWL